MVGTRILGTIAVCEVNGMDFLQYDFMQRAVLAGLITAVVCPVIGMFVVVRRQSLIGDGLGHIAFAGVTGGYLSGIYPMLAAAGLTVTGAVLIELIRRRHAQYADMGLAVIFYAGAALAIIFSTLVRIPSAGMLGFLFGSIMTVSYTDLAVIAINAVLVLTSVFLLFDKLMVTAFDEDVAAVAGINTFWINMFFSILTALVVVTGMAVVGILLVSALMIIPVAAAQGLKAGFYTTLVWAVIFSAVSMLSGLMISFYLDIAPGGTIVMSAILLYICTLIWQSLSLWRGKERSSAVLRMQR